MSYRKVVRHRHGIFRLKTQKGKQWIGGNQFVNAENNYEKNRETEPKHEPKKEPDKPFEPKPLTHSEIQRRLTYHKLNGVTH